jgi:hypothetical protein
MGTYTVIPVMLQKDRVAHLHAHWLPRGFVRSSAQQGATGSL